MSKKEQVSPSELSDTFGFIDEEIPQLKSQKEKSVPSPNEKMEHMYAAIDQFLINLEKNPEKDTIKWPNRAKSISAFRETLKLIMSGKEN